ncbi:monocarboxylate transporter 12-like [Patiria miniata]|uniref:Major facilitator superfamily (MFS) profile domain-containing protein n=1 Tax=Patiria miniata TaxID=46514 RepID=A0A913ZNA6_PATMI|nr:monocarboxylate transporter 12-like [Patiria miniata]
MASAEIAAVYLSLQIYLPVIGTMEQQQYRQLGADRRNRFVGLLAILGTWVNWFIWVGTVKSLATLLPTLRDQMETYTWVIGWIIVIMEVTADLIGPFAAPLGRRFGVRICVMVSGLMIGLAFIIASFSSAAVMAVVLAVLAGPGLGISNVLCKELVGKCFSSRRISTAFAISQSGASISYMVVPPMTQLFLDTYGWRATMLLLGAIFFHMTVCGALFRFPPSCGVIVASNYSVIPDDCVQEEHQSNDNASREPNEHQKMSAFRALCQHLNTELFFNRSYWCLAVMGIVNNVSTLGWAVYFVPHTQTKGFTPKESVILTAIMGMTKVVAAFTLGPLMDKVKIVSSRGFLGIALTSLTVYYLIDPWLTSFWLNAINVAIYACSSFLVWLLTDVLVCEVVTADQLGSAFGWIGIKCAVFSFVLLYLPGLTFDLGGSYTLPFMLLGGLQIFAIVALILLVVEQSRK